MKLYNIYNSNNQFVKTAAMDGIGFNNVINSGGGVRLSKYNDAYQVHGFNGSWLASPDGVEWEGHSLDYNESLMWARIVSAPAGSDPCIPSSGKQLLCWVDPTGELEEVNPGVIGELKLNKWWTEHVCRHDHIYQDYGYGGRWMRRLLGTNNWQILREDERPDFWPNYHFAMVYGL